PLQNRYMLIMGASLFFATALDFIYFELNNNDTFMYNTLTGVELAAVIAMLSSWLLFNPSLLDVGEDPRLPKLVPARVGATAVVEGLGVGKLPDKLAEKSGKGEGKPSSAEISEIVTIPDGPRVPPDAKPDPDNEES